IFKDELVIENASKMQFVAKVCIRLKSQLERLGITPCCQLPDSYKELIEREKCEMEEQTEAQRDLEEKLSMLAEEKQRLNKMLSSMRQEREMDIVVMRSVQERCKEAEEKEIYAAEALSRLTREKSQKERALEETLRLATMDLMQYQAQLAQIKELENTGGFARILKLLLCR
ncbi:kinesin, putative, partial [Trypanosoma cruzi]